MLRLLREALSAEGPDIADRVEFFRQVFALAFVPAGLVIVWPALGAVVGVVVLARLLSLAGGSVGARVGRWLENREG